uniref:NAD-dependent epimerase/dehydratase domain-containing protein n=1 Tax=Chlamydomonas leiostraca TaxID=1034604 RepID=A0A7S0RMX4_9CHLO|mmetsp:Transcript_27141/g.69032  ORF Transcript_27141/g.69032 Transcript_27141/m.69032 type:complete len:410 (+) Transcript_27141:80-1309(+)
MAAHLERVPLFPVEKDCPESVVCITGATGYIAGTLVERLLLSGHTVHATIRDPSRASHLQALPGAAQRLKLFKCDLREPSSFDAAVAGCSVVFHTASPFTVNVPAGQVQERLLQPAVRGTEAVLGAASRAGCVRRVVLTSSVAAVYGDAWDRGRGHVFTEEDWNESCSEASMPYSYSKACAERRAWEVCAEQQGPAKWDLVAICPALVLGPPVSPRADGESVELVAKICQGDFWPACPRMGFGVNDVRVVAAAHCLAAWTPHASGRYIVVGHDVWFSEIAAATARAFPGRVPKPLLPAPTPLVYLVSPAMGVPRDVVRRCFGKLPLHSSARTSQDLGLRCGCVSLQDTMADMVTAMAKHGVVRAVPAPGPRGVRIFLLEAAKRALFDWPAQKLLLTTVSVALVAVLLAR